MWLFEKNKKSDKPLERLTKKERKQITNIRNESRGISKDIKRIMRDFPGGSVVKTPRSQCRGPGFDPWPGN